MGYIPHCPHRPSKGAPLLIKVLLDSIDSFHILVSQTKKRHVHVKWDGLYRPDAAEAE